MTVLLTATLLLAGCAGTGTPTDAQPTDGTDPVPSTADGAGTSADAPTDTSLSLAIVPGLADADVEAFQEQLATRPDSGITLTLVSPVDVQHTRDAEQQLVREVAEGRVDLAWVGARAFRELGVHDLDALVAPMTLDSVPAQEAVLTTDLPDRMLSGLDVLGVTGLAVFPGPIRHPIAADSPLVTLEAFTDVPFFTWQGDVHALTVEALGATDVQVTPEERNAGIEDGSIRAYENSLVFLVDTTGWNTRAMSLNVNLWPSVSVLIANPDTVAGLDDPQLEVLTEVVQAVSATAFDRLADEQQLVDQACAGGATFGVASSAALGEIEAALRPVHDQLRADPVVAAYLDEIEALTAGIEPVVPTVPDSCTGTVTGPSAPEGSSADPTGEASELDGTYEITWSEDDLAEALGGDANPSARDLARGNAGTLLLVIDRGTYDLVFENGDSCSGTAEVDGSRVVLTATTKPSEWDCGDGLGGTSVDAAWSLTDDRLTLTDWEVPVLESMLGFNSALLGSKPLSRVTDPE